VEAVRGLNRFGFALKSGWKKFNHSSNSNNFLRKDEQKVLWSDCKYYVVYRSVSTLYRSEITLILGNFNVSSPYISK
jgi:hypothetical protein